LAFLDNLKSAITIPMLTKQQIRRIFIFKYTRFIKMYIKNKRLVK
jgi:hypothetical protein